MAGWDGSLVASSVRLAQPAPILDSRGFHLLLGGSRASGGRASPPGQSHSACLHTLRRSVPGVNLWRASDAAPIECTAAASRLCLLGEPLIIDYTVQNGRRWFASLAVFLEDTLLPVDRAIAGATSLTPKVFFARIAGRDRLHLLEYKEPGARQVSTSRS